MNNQNELENEIYAMQMELLEELYPSQLKTLSMTDLYDTTFASQPSLIEGFLNRGTYLFVGSPKVGKSFFMLQIAYHISTGTPLWAHTVRKAAVLYLALEDDYKRLQKRLFQMFGENESENLYLATQCKTIGSGLDEQIKGFMQEHPDTGLIIIDTLKRVRDTDGADYSYANDYDIVAKLKALADSHGVTMLIVHHTRKQKAEDVFDMISGTNGLMGAADGAFVLRKEDRTTDSATLDVVGRDQQDMKLYLKRDRERLVWDYIKTENEVYKEPPDPLLERISDFLPSEGDRWDGTASALCKELAVDMKPNVLSLRLSIQESRLFEDYGIRYQNSRSHDSRKVSLWRENNATA